MQISKQKKFWRIIFVHVYSFWSFILFASSIKNEHCEKNRDLQKTCCNFWKIVECFSNVYIVSNFFVKLSFTSKSARNKNRICFFFRVWIIRHLYEWNLTIKSHLKYEIFDFNNQDHVYNASNFYKKMRIKSQSSILTNTVFSLIINSSLLIDTLLLFSFSYANQNAVKNKKKMLTNIFRFFKKFSMLANMN